MNQGSNYLSAEELLCERIAVQVPDFKTVIGARDAKEAQAGNIAMPFCMVIYAGDRVMTGDDAVLNYGAAQVVWQRWLVEVVCDLGGWQSGSQEREEPGLLMSQVIAALTAEDAAGNRWRPSNDHSELRRIQGPSPAYPGGKTGVFPLMFETLVLTN